MKVLFIHYAIIDREGFGRTFKLAREIASLGNSVVFVTTQANSRRKFPFRVEYRENVKIVSFPELLPEKFSRTGFGFFSAILKVLYLIRRHQFDIVHSDTGHRPSAAIPAFFLQFIFRIPHVMEWWDYFGRGGQFDDKSLFKKITQGYYDILFQPCLLKSATGIIVLSEFLKQKALDLKIPGEKIRIVNGGADTSRINFSAENEKLKKRNDILPESLTFGFIGMNRGEFNDLIPFIRAINKLKNELPINWFTTGGIISTELKNKYNISSELIEFGWQDYDSYINSIGCADVFILIQKENIMNEARWPNKIGDYLAAGRMILTNPVGEIKTMVNRFPEVFITSDYNEEDIIAKIKTIYKNKTEIVRKGAEVRRIAESEMSWNLKAIQVLELYDQILISKHYPVKKNS
jgi:glycosyltransferase involved in cell wall biosynthesis